MDRRHLPYDPHAPPDPPRGWVIAGEEPDRPAAPPPRNGDQEAGWPGRDRRYPPAPAAWPAPDPPYQPDPYQQERYQPEPYQHDQYRPEPYQRAQLQPPPYHREPAAPYPGASRLGREPRRHRRADARTTDRRTDPAEADPAGDEVDEDGPPASWLAVACWTACYFLIPVLLYLGWALTRSGTAPPGCVDASGAPCISPRADAIAALVDNGPSLAGALLLAMLVSLALRRLTAAWRASTVAFAAAVIGAGVATLVVSVLS